LVLREKGGRKRGRGECGPHLLSKEGGRHPQKKEKGLRGEHEEANVEERKRVDHVGEKNASPFPWEIPGNLGDIAEIIR